MNCEEFRKNVTPYLQDKLSNEERIGIDRHLTECSLCTAEMESLRELENLLDQDPPIEPSPYFDTRLMTRIEALEKPRGWQSPGWLKAAFHDRYVWSFAVLLITTVGVWLGIRHQQYRELNSLEKVIEVQDHYLGSALGTQKPRGEELPHSMESEEQPKNPVQVAPATTLDEEEMQGVDKALLENLDLLRHYEMLNSFEIADQEGTEKPGSRD
ncbi:MAG: zf-HC2 domain-containing protein [Terriglobia bacterium]